MRRQFYFCLSETIEKLVEIATRNAKKILNFSKMLDFRAFIEEVVNSFEWNFQEGFLIDIH